MIRLTSLGHAAVLVDTGTTRILVDPWLTQRLDRFWEHHPPLPDGLDDLLDEAVDYIVFSHHHFDHHHFPSLTRLVDGNDVDFDDSPHRSSEITCVYPIGEVPPQFTASGLGHQAITWTLRRLGFERLAPVTPGDSMRLPGGATLRTFVSNVPFPEMSVLIETPDGSVMLCGDSILHDSTVEFFQGSDAPRVDVAFVPAHSVSPPGVLTERRPLIDPGAVRARAEANFDRYVDVLGATMTVPSSFGWRVSGEGDNDFSWCNRTIFPLNPTAALGRLRDQGRRGVLWGPGQEIHVSQGEVTLHNGPTAPKGYDFEEIYAEVAFDEKATVPTFAPATDRVGRQTRSTEELLGSLMERLVGTDFWYRALDSGTTHVISVYEDLKGAEADTIAFLLEPVTGRVLRIGPGAAKEHISAGESYTDIAASTLQALLDAELLYGSSYGLWASNSNLLSAVFHQPLYYVQHVDHALREMAGDSQPAAEGAA